MCTKKKGKKKMRKSACFLTSVTEILEIPVLVSSLVKSSHESNSADCLGPFSCPTEMLYVWLKSVDLTLVKEYKKPHHTGFSCRYFSSFSHIFLSHLPPISPTTFSTEFILHKTFIYQFYPLIFSKF